jgi:hypothetical protein
MHPRTHLLLIICISVVVALMLLPLLAGTSHAGEPATPSLVVYIVKTPGDTIQTAGCTGGHGDCTLRGALQLANAAGADVHIVFTSTLYATPIVLSSTLPITGGHISIFGTQMVIRSAVNQPAFKVTSDHNTIYGLSVAGDGASGGDTQDGVVLSFASHNTLTQVSLYNLGGNGVSIQGGVDNVVSLNWIGTSISSRACDQPNQKSGVFVHAAFNFVHENIIACNLNDGIVIDGGLYNAVYENLIGAVMGPTGTNVVVGNGTSGIVLTNGANHNVVGGSLFSQSNYIAGHPYHGVEIVNSPDNRVLHNNLRLNGGFGVLLEGISTTGTLISATVFYNTGWPVNHGGSSIRERNGAGDNVWSHIHTSFNRALAVDKDPTANGLDPPYPVVTSAVMTGAGLSVSGRASPSAFGASTLVEVYSVVLNPDGLSEPFAYLGTTSADANGNWTVVVTAGYGRCMVAMQTRTVRGLTPRTASSEFGPSNCRTFLPLTMR